MQENTRENVHLRDHREENEATKPRIIEARYEKRWWRKKGWGGGLLYQRHNYAVTPSGGGGARIG